MKNLSFDKYFQYLIIGYAFVIPITIAGIVLFEHLIIFSFIIGYFKGHIKVQFSELKESKVIITLGLFLLLSLISVIWSDDKIFALLYIKKYYRFLLIPIIYLAFNTKYIKPVFTSFLLGMLISETFSYLIFFEIIHYNNIPANDPSPFMNHSDYSIYLAFTSMILLNRIFFVHENKIKIFYFLYFLTTTSNLFLNGGRTGQIVFIVSIFVILYLNIHNKVKGGMIAALLVIGILSTAYTVSPVFKYRGLLAYNDIINTIKKDDYSQSFGIRVSLWIMGLDVFKDNFFLGTGIGDEKTGMQQYANKHKITRYQNLPDKGFIDYHSMYIQHAVQLGILGLLSMLYLVYSLFVIKIKSTLYKNISVVFATAILTSSIVSNLLHTIFPMVFFAFFIALITALSKSEKHN